MTESVRCIAIVLAGCLLVGCNKSSSPPVVPAELRDVEREGEGLVSTTFGDAPDRQPSWDRAAIVLRLLHQVWDSAKAKNPGLPSKQVMMLDGAVSKLDVAIAAKNQKDAVIAANLVGLAVPELFDYFHPDAPIEVIRMDAVFRQVGIDAHFGAWDAAASDLASLKTDWMNSRAAVSMRVPTCHRVQGTQSVVGDIDETLKNMNAAVPSSGKEVTETESDNGALEIDVLEQLYDCTPDNVTAPATGTGSKCMKDSDCKDPNLVLVCDKAWASSADQPGKCAPDPAQAKIGTPCTTTADCGTDPRTTCNNEAGDGYPGGYCFMEPCDDVQVCPAGATCVSIGGETPGCYKSCKADSDCRQDAIGPLTPHGYVCQLFSTKSPDGFGPSDRACAFPCAKDDDCKKPLTCDVGTGKCKP